MGFPLKNLVIATNENNILHRIIANNDFSLTDVIKTNSPSMDITISSNFERILAESFSCLLYTSPSPRDLSTSRMPSSA